MTPLDRAMARIARLEAAMREAVRLIEVGQVWAGKEELRRHVSCGPRPDSGTPTDRHRRPPDAGSAA